MKTYLLLFLSLAFTTITAQNYKSGSITDSNNQTTEGRVHIDNSNSTVLFKNEGSSKTISSSSLKEATIGNKVYSKLTFEGNVLLASNLINGKASLFDLTNNEYLIVSENNLEKVFHINNDESQIPGILGVLFEDCNSIRDDIYKITDYNERVLKELVTQYNSCEYGAFTPTETEMKQANTNNTDTFRFHGGFQTEFNSTTVNGFSSNSNTGFGLGVGVAASPGFTGSLQGNLYFDFDFNMTFLGDSDFNNGDTPLNYKVNSYRLNIGLQYQFNKNGTIKPFVGVGFGFTSDHYNGTIGTISFKDDGKNNYFLPKAGVLYQLNNGNHIGIVLSYISEYENNLSFYFGDDPTLYPFVLETTALNLGLNYYF